MCVLKFFSGMDIFYPFQTMLSVLCAYASPSPHTGVRKQLLAHMDIFYRNQSTCECGVCVRVCVGYQVLGYQVHKHVCVRAENRIQDL